jgi:hypothetical protein
MGLLQQASAALPVPQLPSLELSSQTRSASLSSPQQVLADISPPMFHERSHPEQYVLESSGSCSVETHA